MNDTQLSGWGVREHFSPALRARCIADERQFQQELLEENRRRADRAEYDEARRLRLAMEQAEARGEYVSAAQVARTGGACVGRTRSEFISYISAVQDAEDARERARTRQAMPYDAEQHQAALIAINPTVGRTRQEAREYYSALADIQDLEAARRVQQGLPSQDAETAGRALLEKREREVAARRRDRHVRTVAKGAVRNALLGEAEQRYADGEIGDRELREAARRLA
jgi:hypothetical protein